jgi:hypothetical protein
MTTDTAHTTRSSRRRLAARGLAAGATAAVIAAGVAWAIVEQSGVGSSAQPMKAGQRAPSQETAAAVEVFRMPNGVAFGARQATETVDRELVTAGNQFSLVTGPNASTATKLATLTPATSRGPPVLSSGTW